MKKKISQVQQVINLWSKEPNMDAAHMAKALKIPVTRIYTLRNQAIKRMNIRGNDTPVAVTMEGLKAENKKLNDWCLEWNQKCQDLTKENDMLEKQVNSTSQIVSYLEQKLKQAIIANALRKAGTM